MVWDLISHSYRMRCDITGGILRFGRVTQTVLLIHVQWTLPSGVERLIFSEALKVHIAEPLGRKILCIITGL